jgi:hypothetical protein
MRRISHTRGGVHRQLAHAANVRPGTDSHRMAPSHRVCRPRPEPSGRSPVMVIPASSLARRAAAANGSGGRPVGHLGQPRRHRRPGDAQPGVAGREPALARRAVIPRMRHRHRPEYRVHGLVPVRHELCLVPGGAPRAGAGVVCVSGQQRLQHCPAQLQGRRANRQLGYLKVRPAGQCRSRLRDQPFRLRGGLSRELLLKLAAEPPFPPPAQGPDCRARGRAGPRRSPRSPPRSPQPAPRTAGSSPARRAPYDLVRDRNSRA